MKYYQLVFPLAGTFLVSAASALHADDDSDWTDKNRVQLGYRMGFNMSLSLRNIAPRSAYTPSLTGKTYQDGFVGTDDTGNVAGLTTYWSYQNSGQIVNGNSALQMHYSTSGTLASDMNDDFQHGAELTYDRQLIRYKHIHIGAEFAFNWTEFSSNQRQTSPSGLIGVDSFSLGYVPPVAPYSGPYHAGPFVPLLGTTPTTMPVLVSSDFDAKLYGFRLGPYVDVALGKRVLFTFTAGLAVTLVDSQFSYHEQDSVVGDSGLSSGNASDVSAVVGGYVGLQGTVRLMKHVNIFTGFQYQPSEDYKLRSGDKEAKLDLNSSLFWTLGLSYSF